MHISHFGTETYGKQIRTGTGGGGTATFNLGQKVKDKFTKLSKRGCSMECFTAGFLRVLPKNVKIWILGGLLGTRRQIQAFQRFS